MTKTDEVLLLNLQQVADELRDLVYPIDQRFPQVYAIQRAIGWLEIAMGWVKDGTPDDIGGIHDISYVMPLLADIVNELPFEDSRPLNEQRCPVCQNYIGYRGHHPCCRAEEAREVVKEYGEYDQGRRMMRDD